MKAVSGSRSPMSDMDVPGFPCLLALPDDAGLVGCRSRGRDGDSG
jgi:hypothetical protein